MALVSFSFISQRFCAFNGKINQSTIFLNNFLFLLHIHANTSKTLFLPQNASNYVTADNDKVVDLKCIISYFPDPHGDSCVSSIPPTRCSQSLSTIKRTMLSYLLASTPNNRQFGKNVLRMSKRT